MQSPERTEAAAISALDRIADLIIEHCGPLRIWDENEPFDAVLRALGRRVAARQRTASGSLQNSAETMPGAR